jgi:CDP-glycerol glycerophosphotransferase
MPRLAVVLVGDGDRATKDRTLASVAAQQVDAEVRDSVDGCDSTYVTFLTVGDEVASGGYAALLDALDESGAAAAAGRTQPAPPGKGTPFGKRRSGITVETLPLLLRDARAGGIVWRRTSWEQQTPPGTPTALAAGRTALALAAAADVDVLPDVVLRQHQPAATGRSPRAVDMAELADRLDLHLAVSNQLADGGRPAAKAAWDAMVVGGDLRWALSQLTEADDDTQARIVETAGAFLVGAGPEADHSEKAVHRLAMHLARRRLLPQLVEVVKAERTGELAHTRAVRRGTFSSRSVR